MQHIAKEALQTIGDATDILTVKPVRGGSINECYYIKSKKRAYFLKYNNNAPARFFEREKVGLERIEATNTISVPKVYAYKDQRETSYLLLEWIQGNKKDTTERYLGQQIARLHQAVGSAHGFCEDTYIGLLKQENGFYESWRTYYKEKRLKGQIEYGIEQQKLSYERVKKLTTLLDKLDQYLPQQVEPSSLHGDLWGGNWIVGEGGAPYVIDPSFFYGDRHFELAFTELFGGFGEQFYQGYDEIYPIDSYYKEIKDLYQLYYILVHFNLFGEPYGAYVDRIVHTYIGK